MIVTSSECSKCVLGVAVISFDPALKAAYTRARNVKATPRTIEKASTEDEATHALLLSDETQAHLPDTNTNS